MSQALGCMLKTPRSFSRPFSQGPCIPGGETDKSIIKRILTFLKTAVRKWLLSEGAVIIVVVVIIMWSALCVLHALREQTEKGAYLPLERYRAPACPVGTLLFLQGGQRAKGGRTGPRKKKQSLLKRRALRIHVVFGEMQTAQERCERVRDEAKVVS